METAQTLQHDPAESTAAASRGSFWTSAPGLLTGIATLIGSVVGLATVLVQAGVIGSSATTTQAGLVQSAPPVETAPADRRSVDRALRDLNGLLAGSARTKGNLGSLIGAVQSSPPAIDRDTALREIDAIVRQREELHAELAAFRAPSSLSGALALLRDSITASLADDRLVRRWIVATYDGDAAAGPLRQAEAEASIVASRAKSAFRAEYAGHLASSGLPSSIPDY